MIELVVCFGFIFLVIGLLVLFYLVTMYNGLVVLRNNIDKAWSNIDVLLKQRSDLIPNLVNTVKSYMKHEKQTLAEITKLRTSIMKTNAVSGKAKASEGLTEALKTIFAVSENYPKLRANENFLELQKQLTAIENQIADRREFYNDSVLLYNTRIRTIPDSIIASILSMKKKEYFQASSEEKEKVEVQLSR